VAPASTYTYTPDSNVLDSVRTSGVTQTIGITAAGNINSFSPALPSGITALTYNQANRLATASASGTQVAAYTYDAFGHRLEKVTSTTTALFQYDQGGHLLEELNGSGAAQADYLYLGDMPLATLTPSTGALYCLHDDTLGTPQLASSNTQAVSWSTTYQPFGTTGTITGSLTQNIRLPGQYADAETGFSQNGARDYAPSLGRYLEPDPIGLVGGVNTYGYAKQNPWKYVDPTGTIAGADDAIEAILLCASSPACAAAATATVGGICYGVNHAVGAMTRYLDSVFTNDASDVTQDTQSSGTTPGQQTSNPASGQTAADEAINDITAGLPDITNPGANETNLQGQGGAAGAQADLDRLTNVPGSAAQTAPNGATVVTLPDGSVATLYPPTNSPGANAAVQITRPGVPTVKIKY
jgi:RHS repeat-associated protein